MKTSILIVSYLKDKPWLLYCVRSIVRFASGFHTTVLLVPESERKSFDDLIPAGPTNLVVKSYKRTEDNRKWHLHHQLMKCRADELCPDSDFVLHTDSDCIFTEAVRPEDYFDSGKPVMLIESFKKLGQYNWKQPTDNALGIDSIYETMRRHPAVHYTEMYHEFRNVVEKHSKKSFDGYVLSCKPDYPWGFSEFNAIGNFILTNPRWIQRYKIVNLDREQRPHEKLMQFWSHWGIDGKITDKGPNYGITPRQIMERYLKPI